MPEGDWICPICTIEKCEICGKGDLNMSNRVTCGDREEETGCGRVFHYVYIRV